MNIKMNLIDKAIGVVAPVTALNRAKARTQLSFLTQNSGAYRGASKSDSFARKWRTRRTNADTADLGDRDILEERSQDLYRNAPLATAATGTLETNVVGSGLRLQSHIDREFLGLSEDEAENWQRDVERKFSYWADTHLCDITRTSTFGQIQNIAYHSCLIAGDVLALLPIIERKGKKTLAIKLLESAHLSNPNGTKDSAKIAGGVEVDENSTPIKYHITKYHPYGLNKNKQKWTAIPAFGKDTDRQNVILLMDKKRPGQRRGVSVLAPVIESLKQLSRYTEAELMAAVVSGMFTVFVKSEPVYDDDGNLIENDFEESAGLGNGAVVNLNAGEDISIADPKRPNTAFEPFTVALARYICSALQLPYEVVIKHFTASYSASRGALLEAWKFFRVRRNWLADNFCQIIYKEWLTFEIASGRIVADGFLDDDLIAHAYTRAVWVGAGQGQLNPLVETKSAVLKIENNLSTGRRESAEMNGSDFDMNVERCGVERRKKIENKLLEEEVENA